MKLRLDYLSSKVGESYSLADFREDAEQPQVDKATGAVIGVLIPASNYRVDRRYNNITVSTYRASVIHHCYIAHFHNLPITRIDLAIDRKPQPGYESIQEAKRLVDRITAFYKRKKRNIITGHHTGYDPFGNAIETWTFGSRASLYQIRIYTKHLSLEDFGVYRVEFQLRKRYAVQIWAKIRPKFEDQITLLEAMQAIEAKVLEQGMLDLPEPDNLPYQITSEPEREASKREHWIRTQVLSACIKEFNETGLNLPELLREDFNNHFLGIAKENAEYNETTVKLHKREVIKAALDIFNAD